MASAYRAAAGRCQHCRYAKCQSREKKTPIDKRPVPYFSSWPSWYHPGMEENPYKAPNGLKRRPTVAKAVLAVLTCTIAGALFGAGIGYMLGRFAPAYYRSVFRNGNAPGFDPVQVGTGLGMTQGVALGFIAGIIIVIVLMRRTRKAPVCG
jgi:F0F1-type ATP synthase assembly protein I